MSNWLLRLTRHPPPPGETDDESILNRALSDVFLLFSTIGRKCLSWLVKRNRQARLDGSAWRLNVPLSFSASLRISGLPA